MKKILFPILMATLVSSSVALGQNSPATKSGATTEKKPCYVDANNNKVCDRYENHTCKGGNGTGAPDCRRKSQTQSQAQGQSQTQTDQVKKDNKKPTGK